MSEPFYSERFIDALQRAARWHQGQRRKGTGIPYISHLLRVCALVLDDGGTEDEACAALLHDAVEDTRATIDDVARFFGREVALIVGMCSDDDGTEEVKPPWKLRKEEHFAHLAASPDFDARVARVMAADKLANLTTQLDDDAALGPASWDRFKGGLAGTLWYLETATSIIKTQLGEPSRLPDQLDAGLVRLRAIRDDVHSMLDGLDARIADSLHGAEAPKLPGWSTEAVELASFEIARSIRVRGVDPRTATVTVLANWFGTPISMRSGTDAAKDDALAIDRLADLVAAQCATG